MIKVEKYLNSLNLRRCTSLPQSRGQSYVIGWGHRLSGLFLLFYVLLHINTLSSLSEPEIFRAKAETFSGPLFVLFEWLLAVPVIFHCLNGGRLLIYELFTTRYDDLLRPWVLALSAVYLFVLGYLMIVGDQSVSAHFFWLIALIISITVTYPVVQKIRQAGGSFWWKLQRLSGTFLFILVPAHMLFMHLNPAMGRDVQIITERLSQPLITIIDGLLLAAILYHGGYGLIGIIKDYLTEQRLIRICTGVVIVILVLFGLQGIILVGSF